jgi:myo-inositol-1(or 4)-monophosphatase
MDYDLEQLQQIIVAAGKEELLPRFTRVERSYKADGSVLTEADLAVQERIAVQLQQRWPDTVFLGEEMSAGEQQKLLASDKPAWCLDPLDGTRNFSSGIPFFWCARHGA